MDFSHFSRNTNAIKVHLSWKSHGKMNEKKNNNVVVDKALCKDGWRCKVIIVMKIHLTVVVNAKNGSIENIVKLALKDLKYPVSDALWHWQKLIKVVNGWMQSIGYGEINWRISIRY